MAYGDVVHKRRTKDVLRRGDECTGTKVIWATCSLIRTGESIEGKRAEEENLVKRRVNERDQDDLR